MPYHLRGFGDTCGGDPACVAALASSGITSSDIAALPGPATGPNAPGVLNVGQLANVAAPSLIPGISNTMLAFGGLGFALFLFAMGARR